MQLNNSDSDFIKELFLEYLNDYREGGKALGWEGSKEQYLRFQVILSCIKGENNSLLDVGCGIGDLYKYIQGNNSIKIYTGVDILENSINIAKNTYPDGNFYLIQDIQEIKENTFDYIVASGIFAVNIKKAKEKYLSMIRELFLKSKKGFVFNMLDKSFILKDAPEIIQFSPNEILDFCKTITKNVKLIQGYLPIDFTIYMKHE